MGNNIDIGTLEESKIIFKRLCQMKSHEMKKAWI